MLKAEGFKSKNEMEEAKSKFIDTLTPEEMSVTKMTVQGNEFVSITIESELNIEDKVKLAFGKFYRE